MSAFVKSFLRRRTGGVIEGVPAKYYQTTYIIKHKRSHIYSPMQLIFFITPKQYKVSHRSS